MPRSRPAIAAVLLLVLIGAGFLAGYGVGRSQAALGGDAESQGFALLRELLHHVRTTYLERQVDTRSLFYGAARGMLEALGDPYTRFLDPEAYREYREHLGGVFHGVGLFVELQGDRPVVVTPIPRTPAYRAGIRAGDRILAVDGVDTRGMSLEEVVTRIRGPAGSAVTLRLGRGERVFTVRLVRARIANVSVQGDENLPPAQRAALRATRVAYVRILLFNETTAREFARAVEAARAAGARGLLLDLRNNGGGLLDVAVEVADRFVPAGQPIVHTVDRQGRRQTQRATRGPKVTLPAVVLVNEFTASAGEILAGALRDHDVAPLVGLRTFGKGVIQSVVSLPGGAGATITSGKYLTPDGHDIHGTGITPTLVAGARQEGRSEAEVARIEAEQFARAFEVLRRRLSP
ncbi:MAG: S41 family peptidase [Armatimonadota bacterium]|nr:S41 family peptidase [Armatimonadota bacterium]MDR7447862.1 S41 family peptidase [Armatimonadota bacterium]MDR7459931.1 S41 family peptidase [Armatimonadota bacterium]MDR7479790.1 S41 family peptidase [Armatimonadota bacterium]MDR7487547.1 S41 family peptidase [Armatimonadota bacterium]